MSLASKAGVVMVNRLILGIVSILVILLLALGCSQPTQNQANAQEFFNQGYSQGYSKGYQEGYAVGASDGTNTGYSKGYQDGVNSGYQAGLSAGTAAVLSVWPTNVPKPLISQGTPTPAGK